MKAILVATCGNLIEPDGRPCCGSLRYQWGQTEAACDTCGERCGVAVAPWLRVEHLDSGADQRPREEDGGHADQRDRGDQVGDHASQRDGQFGSHWVRKAKTERPDEQQMKETA